ncbi:hypothetical protein BRADI_2g29816v3 [Brachypodium distachyon]|uniref:Uncharacterized protein n=1 Tax=Brachypodium distachyon TaxID=15368 RepID=A0A0Q3ILP6_BRADI|nr:hypothetical protein BRADI_2g29816v3 [Brachypodium distachyon]
MILSYWPPPLLVYILPKAASPQSLQYIHTGRLHRSILYACWPLMQTVEEYTYLVEVDMIGQIEDHDVNKFMDQINDFRSREKRREREEKRECSDISRYAEAVVGRS